MRIKIEDVVAGGLSVSEWWGEAGSTKLQLQRDGRGFGNNDSKPSVLEAQRASRLAKSRADCMVWRRQLLGRHDAGHSQPVSLAPNVLDQILNLGLLELLAKAIEDRVQRRGLTPHVLTPRDREQFFRGEDF